MLSFFGIKNLNSLREIGGYFNDFEVYVLILLLFRKDFNLEFMEQKATLYIFVVGVSVIFYFARTNILQFFILLLGMKGYFRFNYRSFRVISISLISMFATYTTVYYSNPKREGNGIEAFLYKVKIAPIEAFKTKINENDWKDFNDNYRSFENIITVKQVSSKGVFAILFGEGLGSTIDIGRLIWTNDGEFIRYVPTLHNAYMTIYLKSGLLGVFLTLVFLTLVFRQTKYNNQTIISCNYLLVGTAVFLILSNWVFMGLYLKLDNKSIFIGFLLCYREIVIKNNLMQTED